MCGCSSPISNSRGMVRTVHLILAHATVGEASYVVTELLTQIEKKAHKWCCTTVFDYGHMHSIM
jgi:hypothetical protein